MTQAAPDTQPPARQSNASRGPIVLLSLLIAGGLSLLGWQLFTHELGMNIDGAMYLEGALTLLDGGLPYVDFVDINPPLIIYLHTVPAVLSKMSGLHPIAVFYALLFLATFLSCALSYRLLIAAGETDRTRALVLSLAPALLMFLAGFEQDIGQREHLFVLALLPYLLTRVLRAQGKPVTRGEALLSGLFMAATAALKPLQFVALILPVEIYLLAKYRRFDTLRAPEVLVAVIFVLLYSVHFLLLPEESTARFFSEYLPLILESYDVYDGDPQSLISIAAADFGFMLAIAIGCTILLGTRADSRYRDVALAALLVAFSAAAVYLAQGKGWSYHALPVLFAAIVVIAVCCAHPPWLAATGRFGRLTATAPLLVIAVACIAGSIRMGTKAMAGGQYDMTMPEVALIREVTAANDTVMILGTSVDAAFPLLIQVGRRSGTRFGFAFPIPLLYDGALPDPSLPHQNKIADDRRAGEKTFLNDLNTDIRDRKPALIMVDNADPCIACPDGMSLIGYFTGHASELPALQAYRLSFYTDRFEIWQRLGD